MMKRLSTYAEWVSALEQFNKGDDTVLADMEESSFILDAGTSQRFYSRVEEVYKSRKKTWLDKFNSSFQFQNIKSIDDFEIFIRNTKSNLIPIGKFVSSKGLPDELKKTLIKDFEDFISEMKQSMKDSVLKTMKNRDTMLIHLNNFGLYQEQENFPTQTATQTSTTSSPAPGRRIIF